MTPELKWLMYTALLAGSLWIPFIIGVNSRDSPGKEQQFVRPPLAAMGSDSLGTLGQPFDGGHHIAIEHSVVSFPKCQAGQIG